LKVDNFNLEFLDNVSFNLIAEFFFNYRKNPENIDVSLENIITFKVNKYLSLNFIAHLKYDDDIIFKINENQDGITDKQGPRTQFKEIIGIGVGINFNNSTTLFFKTTIKF